MVKVRTNAPSALDTVARIMSEAQINCVMTSRNEMSVDCSEPQLRLILQEKLDENKFDFANDFVLVDGNSVWSLSKIKKELSKIKKSGTTDGISKYFYNFMMNFTIAHYNIHGWCAEHPTWGSVKDVLNGATCPEWKTDVKNILEHFKRM